MAVGTDIARLIRTIDELDTGIAADLETGSATEEQLRFLKSKIEQGIQKLEALRTRVAEQSI